MEIRKHPVFNYKFSSCGEHAWSLDRRDSLGRLWKGREKKIYLMGNKAGTHGRKSDNQYWATMITHEGKSRCMRMADLVAPTFLGPRPPGQVVRHGPGGKLDDSVENLSYGTKSQDHEDKVRDGTDNRGEKHWNCKLPDTKVREIFKARGTQQSIADKFGCSRSYVSMIKNGKSRKHG